MIYYALIAAHIIILSHTYTHPYVQAPDIRGYWRDTTTGEIGENIEQCGSRWIDESLPVIHDFMQCTGVVGDGWGVQDYNGPIIVSQDTLCVPIVVGCKFEQDDDGNKCINLYTKDATTNVTSKVVSRCLNEQNGQMIWTHPIFGTVIYEKVDEEDEPNCVQCVGGEYDGVSSFSTEDVLPCSYQERKWVQCGEDDEKDEDDTPAATTPPSSGHTLQPTVMIVMIAGVILHFANV